MYGALRFLYANAVTAAMISLSSQAFGKVSGIKKIGTGVAAMSVSGSFGAPIDLIYTIEIDSTSAGKGVGEATFAWRTNRTSGDWEETGVLTRTSPVIELSADGYNSGLSISFIGAEGDDFEKGDYWQFIAKATHGPVVLLDRQRMTYWQTKGCSDEYLLVDAGAALAATTCLLYDHNLTSAAVVTLQGNDEDNWTTPNFSLVLDSEIDPLYAYFDTEEYAFWRVSIQDAANPDGYIRIGNFFLGNYVELEQANAWWDSTAAPGVVLQSNQSEAGIMRRYVYAAQEALNLNFGDLVSNEDIARFIELQTNLLDAETNRVLPLWVHLFSDSANHFWLMDWDNLGAWSHTYFAYLLNSGVTMVLKEVVKI